jgi:precorrin-6A/cobalt-precorrin-6A reductase
VNLLLLGGTADARHMAGSLHEHGVTLIYSIAGLVRLPNLPCEIASGGFSQYGGLINYIKQHEIGAILDMTHPYASTMSQTARQAAQDSDIPCWRFSRPAWQPVTGDIWHEVTDWNALLPLLAHKQSIFLSSGQVAKTVLLELLKTPRNKIILRTAVKPDFDLPEGIEWMKAIGPFNIESERELLKKYGVDAVVSKNSGGDAVVAKLQAARELAVPVYMFSRPAELMVDKNFMDASSCKDFVVAQCALTDPN